MGFSATLRKLLFGNPFGEVFPPKPNPPPLSIDGRTAALRVLRQYVTELTFYRAGDKGSPPVPFKILPANFHIEWPDGAQDMVTPSIVVRESPNATYNAIGLASYVEEETADAYQKGTVLQWQSEYNENINLEIWASSKAERRAILAGLETAFVPTEQMYGIRFQMPEYFDELVCFSLNKRRIIDDAGSGRNRRLAQLEVEMRFTVVALVNYVPLQPTIVVNTDVDMDTQVPVDLDPEDPNTEVLDQEGADPNADPDTGSG